MSVKVLHAHDT